MKPEFDGPILLTVEETAKLLRLSRSTVYTLLGAREIPSVRIRRSRRIPLAGLTDYIDGLAA